jgi:hypothetical protein
MKNSQVEIRLVLERDELVSLATHLCCTLATSELNPSEYDERDRAYRKLRDLCMSELTLVEKLEVGGVVRRVQHVIRSNEVSVNLFNIALDGFKDSADNT